jgi:hypothetical protein
LDNKELSDGVYFAANLVENIGPESYRDELTTFPMHRDALFHRKFFSGEYRSRTDDLPDASGRSFS